MVRSATLASVVLASAAMIATPLDAQTATTNPALYTGTPVAQPMGPSSGASADYRVGAGDLLSITVYRAPDLTEEVRVGTDGTISFPSLGKVDVNDKTAGDIAARLVSGLKSAGILVNPSVNVLVSEVRSKVTTVMGAVGRPGEIPLDRPGITIAAVLARAGALFGTGSGVVTILGSSATDAPREQMLISDLVSGAKDRPARAGEILVVQAAPTIYVSGEVGRPGSFSLEPAMTVGQAIALGGGITPRGSQSRINLSRKKPDGTVQEFKNIKFTMRLQPDDLVYVRQRLF